MLPAATSVTQASQIYKGVAKEIRLLTSLAAFQKFCEKAIRLMEVEQTPAVVSSTGTGKCRLGFANGSWLEIEGGFEKGAVRELAEILREAGC